MALTRGLPDIAEDEDDTVREEGTACHWLAHQSSQGIIAPAGVLAPNGVPITEEMQDATAMYFEAVAEWGVPAWFELPVVCERIHPECGGTMDVGAVDYVKRVLYVGDLKFGYRFVDVMHNAQLLCYLVGLIAALNILYGDDWEVEFLIVQPRSYHRDGPVRRWRVRLSELQDAIDELSVAADMAMSRTPICTINPGCKRCAGRGRCTTAQTSALDAMEISHAATPHDLPFAAAEHELRMLREAQSIIEARVTGLEQQVIFGMRRGQPSRHWAMEQSRGRKAWAEGSEAIVRNLGILYGVQVTKDTLITPTQAEKLLPASTLAKYSHRPPGAMKLVPVETSRTHRALTKGK